MIALILVDLQNDFMPTGTLPVPDGDQVISLINDLQKKYDLIVATQDWHPENHKSFAVFHNKQPGEIIQLDGMDQVLWPVHCVQNTKGAELVADLNIEKIDKLIQKGIDPEIDSYSGFFDNYHKRSTGLGDYLKQKNVTEVHITGLALDYCVKFSALDAMELGFKTSVFSDATRAVNINKDDGLKAILEMKAAGISILPG